MNMTERPPDRQAYPLPSGPTDCTWQPVIVRKHWRFGPKDPKLTGPTHPKARQTAWCVGCETLLEVQAEGTGEVLYSGFPHVQTEDAKRRSALGARS
jgi:hypothetical protein